MIPYYFRVCQEWQALFLTQNIHRKGNKIGSKTNEACGSVIGAVSEITAV